MADIQIGPYSFSLADPYFDGCTLDEHEAKALNVLRGERIRNNLAKLIVKLGEGLPDGSILSGERLAALRARASDLDKNFHFVSKTLSKSKPVSLEGETRSVARERALEQCRRVGREDDLALVKSLEEQNMLLDEVVEEARRRLQTRSEVAKAALDDLLGAVE